MYLHGNMSNIKGITEIKRLHEQGLKKVYIMK